jgi:hypothetical protein
MSVTSPTDRTQSFAYNDEMSSAAYTRRLKRNLRIINALLIINGIAWTVTGIMLIRYFFQ